MNNRVVDVLNAMSLRPADQWMRDDADYWARIVEQAAACPVVVLPHIDAPAVVCGIAVEAGRGEMWMIAGAGFTGRIIGVVLAQQRSLCRSMIDCFELHELRMSIWPGHDAAGRWAQRLGFAFDRIVASELHDGKDVEIWIYQCDEKECQNGFS